MITLWAVVSALLAVHLALTITHYRVHELPWLVRQIFDVDEEDSFPTWYSAAALLLTAMTLAVRTRGAYQTQDPWRKHWGGLAWGFLFLSMDEIAGLHETLNSVTPFSWAIPGAAVGLLVGVAYLRFLFHLPRPIALAFAIGGAIFLGGAVGVEWLTEPFLENDALDTLPYNVWTAVEEGMEMGGVLIFLNALFKEMAGPTGLVRCQISLRS